MTGHFFVVVWRLWLLVRVQPGTPSFLPLILVLVNLLPVAGLHRPCEEFSKACRNFGHGASGSSPGGRLWSSFSELRKRQCASYATWGTAALLSNQRRVAHGIGSRRGLALGLQMFGLGKEKTAPTV